MIKLSKIYSNKEDVFPNIVFRDGLNVIFASVSDDNNESSHSLGKTTLVEVIDFCLLKEIKKESVLKKNCFEGIALFLEIQSNEDEYVTIKRFISGKISLHSHKKSSIQRNLPEWDYSNLTYAKAKSILNDLICPSFLKKSKFNFRSGLRYSLRTQTDYEDTFKVRSSLEGNINWVPYLGSVLGINPNELTDKFIANKKVESLKSAIKQIKDMPLDNGQTLEAEIEGIQTVINKMKVDSDEFDFKTSDDLISTELIEKVSVGVASLIKELYSIDRKLLAINSSLQSEFFFDLNKTLSLFKDVEIYFPDSLKKSYEDLIELNKEMTDGRKSRLLKTRKELTANRLDVEASLSTERSKQKKLSQLLLQKDAFKKYKALCEKISEEESRVATLKEKLSQLDIVGTLSEKLEVAKIDKLNKGKALEPLTKTSQNKTLSKAVSTFSKLAESILELKAFFYTEINKDGNLQFKIQLKNKTSINRGFSYTRVLSAIFDLTLLLIHENIDFYRFSYHDGLLESLDDRIKLKLISLWREISEEHNLQLIITVLDSDLPLENGHKVYFPKNEIIRELHDKGDDGRLFKMPSF